MKGRIGTLAVGILLGLIISLPATAFAADWLPPWDGPDLVEGQMAMRGQSPTPQDKEAEGEGPSHGVHQPVHALMDAMMGEGTSARMHESMPGSEQMMEGCVLMMEGMMERMGSSGMMDGHMMDGGMGMMHGRMTGH